MYEVNECFNQIYELAFPQEPLWTSLTFTKSCWLKLQCYINLIGDYEITGFGRIVDNKIIDVKILKQEVKSATVDCDVDAMMKFLTSIPKEQRGQWTLDWHSHVKMGTFASGTDTSNYKEQFEARLRKQFPFIIVNQLGSVYARCYISPTKETPIEILVDNEEVTKEQLLALYEECKKDVQELCTRPVYKSSVGFNYGYYGYGVKDTDDYDYSNWTSKDKLSTSHHGKCGSKSSKKKDVKKEKEDTGYDEYTKQLLLEDETTYLSSRYSSYDEDDFCQSCHTYLSDADEYDRGLCDDCWEKLTPNEQYQYLIANRNKK